MFIAVKRTEMQMKEKDEVELAKKDRGEKLVKFL